MSKAAHHQAIRRDDFMKTMPIDRNCAFQTPTLPSLQDTVDDDDDTEGDAAVKLHPIDIGVLKELMWRKVQKITVVGGAPSGKKDKGQGLGASGLNSRQSSKVSIKSAESGSRSKL